jgi:hypothetical protein
VTPSPLQTQFDKIAAEHKKQPQTKLLSIALTAVQDAVKVFQDEGAIAALLVRPADSGMDKKRALPVVANGMIVIDGLETPFVIERPERGASDYLHVQLLLGTFERTIWVRQDAENLKDNVVTALLRIRAEKEFAEGFSLGGNGITKTLLEKFPSPKLPKP